MNKKKIILIAAATVVAIAIIAIAGYWLKRTEPIIIQGTVECTTYKASSKIAGRIVEMNLNEGERVTKGELLYTLSTPELEAKLQQVEAAKSAATALDQKVLAGAREQQIEEARNLWQKAQAGRILAQRTFERIKTLYQEGVVAAQKYDEAEANYQAATATEAAAKAQYELAVDGASREDKQAAKAQVTQAAGAVNEVESYIQDARVYSPIDGEISSIIAEQGELVGSGYPVISIIETSDMWVTFNIKETLLPKIKAGNHITAYIPALDSDIVLEIKYISSQADFATWSATRTQGGFDIRTFAVKAYPTQPVEGLRPGMSVLVNWNEL